MTARNALAAVCCVVIAACLVALVVAAGLNTPP